MPASELQARCTLLVYGPAQYLRTHRRPLRVRASVAAATATAGSGASASATTTPPHNSLLYHHGVVVVSVEEQKQDKGEEEEDGVHDAKRPGCLQHGTVLID